MTFNTIGGYGSSYFRELSGKYYAANRQGSLFMANTGAVTVPVIAANLVSVFSLYNPSNSGVVMEVVDFEIGQLLATTVVDSLGWYFSSGTNASGPAGTGTAGTIKSGTVGVSATANPSGVNTKASFFTALTHTDTPALTDIIASFGAVTDAGAPVLPSKVYDGRLLIPPGILMSVAASTAAFTASGVQLSCRWIEWGPNAT